MKLQQSVRYQVFVSSTFTDLKEERAEVLQAIWELDCIPTGMEAFLATNESQWEVIQKVIDECDYYVLIIGGRYGSITPEGISYTEKEYNYAKSLDIPVLCFVHGEPGSIVASKTEVDEKGRQRLEIFRGRVMKEHPVRTWTSAQELGGLVSRSMSRAIKVSPRPGWVRNAGASNLELLEQINALTLENSALKDAARSVSSFSIDDELQSGDDEMELTGGATVYNRSDPYSPFSIIWTATATWDDLFRDIGSILMHEASEFDIKKVLAAFIEWSDDFNATEQGWRERSVHPETFAEVMVQFRALGLIDKGTRKRAVSDRASYWALTEQGERHLVTLLAKRKFSTPNPLPVAEVEEHPK